MKTHVLFLMMVLLFLLAYQPPVLAGSGDQTGSKSVRIDKDYNAYKASGECEYIASACSVAGVLFDYSLRLYGGKAYVTFDVRGWDWLGCHVGIEDEYSYVQKLKVSIEVDGTEAWAKEMQYGEKPAPILIDLRGHKAVKFTAAVTKGDNYSLPCIMEPTLYKGQPPSNFSQPTNVPVTALPSNEYIMPATFAVDPKDLDTLAASLRTEVDADAALRTRVDEGQMALMTFILVDIPSQSVATNVAEDLSTAMIKNKFHLVERGQLDNVLKELKIQDTGLIDPSTAKEIGNLTGCDLILVGSISDRGQFVVINARLLETETGKALIAERVEMRKIQI